MSFLKRILLRVSFMLLTVLVYAMCFVCTFLYGSPWLPNSAYSLAFIPSLVTIAIIGVLLFFVRNKKNEWKGFDFILGGLFMATLVSVSLALLGVFSKSPSENKGMQEGSGYVRNVNEWIYYHQSSSDNGTAVLVLHGGPGSGSYLTRAELCDSLDTEFRMIYFDQRGTGRSSWATSFTLDDYLDDMEALRKQLGIDSWVLFSTSWGAVLANEYALRYPSRVKGIINWGGLISSQEETKEMIRHLVVHYDDQKDFQEEKSWRSLLTQQQVFSRFQTFKTVNAVNRSGLKSVRSKDQEIEEVLRYREKAMNEWGYHRNELGANLWVTLATFMQLRLESYDFSKELTEIHQPYLFLVGDQDPQMNISLIEDYKKLMDNASIEIVENSGHLFDEPGQVIAHVRSFIHEIEVDKPVIKSK